MVDEWAAAVARPVHGRCASRRCNRRAVSPASEDAGWQDVDGFAGVGVANERILPLGGGISRHAQESEM